jgi:hypothetical protein
MTSIVETPDHHLVSLAIKKTTKMKENEEMISMEKHKMSIEFFVEKFKKNSIRIDILENNNKEQRRSLKISNEQLDLYKSLVEHNAIFVNTYSQDCDGVESYYSEEFFSIEEYNKGLESFQENVEGRCHWNVVSPQDRLLEEEQGVFGQGWGIN